MIGVIKVCASYVSREVVKSFEREPFTRSNWWSNWFGEKLKIRDAKRILLDLFRINESINLKYFDLYFL